MKSFNSATIVFIINYFYPYYSGAAKNAEKLIEELIKYGYQIIVITPNYGGNKNNDSLNNVTILRINYPPILSHFFYHLCVFWKLIIFKKKRPLFIQLFGLKQRGYAGAILFSKLFGHKIIGRISMLGSDDLLSIRTKSGRLGELRNYICSKYDKIVCTSNKIYLETKKEISDQRIISISQAVDTNLFRPATNNKKKKTREENNINNEKFVVLFCGMPIYRKGFDTIINIWPEIIASIPNALLVVVGPTAHRSLTENDFPRLELAQLLKREEIKNSILLVGECNTPEVYYQAADIFLFPSRQEGFPNALLEAMACGLPSAIFDYPWAEDIDSFKHMDNIIISEKDNLESIVKNVIMLNNDLKLMHKIGSNARKTVLNSHSLKNHVFQYHSMYSNL